MSSDEQQIRELVATWMSATRNGDLATVLSLMTDDVAHHRMGQGRFRAAIASLLGARLAGVLLAQLLLLPSALIIVFVARHL